VELRAQLLALWCALLKQTPVPITPRDGALEELFTSYVDAACSTERWPAVDGQTVLAWVVSHKPGLGWNVVRGRPRPPPPPSAPLRLQPQGHTLLALLSGWFRGVFQWF
jgi:hypothetical protein